MYYSQFEQDKFVNETFFKNKKNGFFVDIGAHNGEEFSNSLFFENLGWDGICIEPNPKVFKELNSKRKCLCIQKAISNEKGTSQFFHITEGPDMLSGLVDDFTQKHIKRIHNELDNVPSDFEYIDVETDTLKNILQNRKKIDLLSLDTEGNEMKILQTINFDEFDIDVIVLENNDYDDKFVKYLSSKNYSPITRLGCDEVYKKNT